MHDGIHVCLPDIHTKIQYICLQLRILSPACSIETFIHQRCYKEQRLIALRENSNMECTSQTIKAIVGVPELLELLELLRSTAIDSEQQRFLYSCL